jgi:hypothetical protein
MTDFKSTDPSDFFWPCPCSENEWQKQYGRRRGLVGNKQARCTVCLQVADFFRQSKEDQAIQIRALLGYQALLSSWVAVEIEDHGKVSIPADVARECAGWNGRPYNPPGKRGVA